MEILTNFFNLYREIISPLNQFEIYNLFSVDAPAYLSRKLNIVRVKLSNSWESLKLLVPSLSRKVVSVWVNYSCMVISQKILEILMGNHGSKSRVLSLFVLGINFCIWILFGSNNNQILILIKIQKLYYL